MESRQRLGLRQSSGAFGPWSGFYLRVRLLHPLSPKAAEDRRTAALQDASRFTTPLAVFARADLDEALEAGWQWIADSFAQHFFAFVAV